MLETVAKLDTPSAASAIFVGDGSLLVTCAELFLSSGHSIAGVSSSSEENQSWAINRGISLLGPAKDLDLSGLEFDFLFSVANLEILPDQAIGAAKSMAINFHDGPLPQYGGLNTPSWALLNGEKRYGVTWHEMVADVDAGRIVKSLEFEVSPKETAYSLNTKCYAAATEAFQSIIDEISASSLELSQQAKAPTIYKKSLRPSQYGFIDFSQPSFDIERLVRALDYGAYDHPLGRAKIWLEEGPVVVSRASSAASDDNTADAGRVLTIEPDSITVATGHGVITLSGILSCDGKPVNLSTTLQRGQKLPLIGRDLREQIDGQLPDLANAHASWIEDFRASSPVDVVYPRTLGDGSSTHEASNQLPLGAIETDVPTLIAGFSSWLAMLSNKLHVSIALEGSQFLQKERMAQGLVREDVLLNLEIDQSAKISGLVSEVRRASEKIVARAPILCDAIACLADEGERDRAVGALNVGVYVGNGRPKPRSITLHVDENSQELSLVVDPRVHDRTVAEVMAKHLSFFLEKFVDAPGSQIQQLPLVPDNEKEVFDRLNLTNQDFSDACGIDEVISAMARELPDQPAVEWNDVVLSYSDLEERAESFSRLLLQKGVGARSIVGLCMARTPDLIVALLGILKCGAAYLPLDPSYPRDRLLFMLEDSGAELVVTDPSSAERIQHCGADTVMVADTPSIGGIKALERSSGDLAYLIYTSGSTGKPKGVMVTHRNVLNFFAAMDARVPSESGGRLLAVTSPSFDISVLELCWTLSRGLTVIFQSQDAIAHSNGPGFSLFYFSSDAASRGREAYRLLLEGAKFADENGFEAVWTPERHFHSFGGLFPNPAVAGAAVAAITNHIHVRAGSCVFPLHHPIRAAEDWALVDNLSDGRAGIALASGWQPNDFVIRPEAFEERKQHMIDGIGQLRDLWRGEKVAFPGHAGTPVEVSTLPRPVKDDIPIWITAAGNPETFEVAGKNGCNVLTHLLGQTFEEVAEKVAGYRKAWVEAGHAGQGKVTLMLHTFVGDDHDFVQDVVREPMMNYLRGAMDLVKKASWSFPTFVQRGQETGRTPAQLFEEEELTEDETQALLEHAFQRYYKTSGLFGAPENCVDIVRKSAQIGVDEIACLIDFGIEKSLVLDHLPYIKKVMDLVRAEVPVDAKASVANDILSKKVTHLQCTPSMASMLVADSIGRTALSELDVMMVGGEALPLSLATELRSNLSGEFLNMYGPTETTIWSATQTLDKIGDFVPLGTPVANTSIKVVNEHGAECPSLVPGEIVIGGSGVTNGYWKRPDLTSERFISDRLADHQGKRLYRTGDLARRHSTGAIEFLGRIDHQVKIRGHRIELGEIEAALSSHSSVRDAVVRLWAEPSGSQLVGYVVPVDGQTVVDTAALLEEISERLPEVMLPTSIVSLSKLPQTPNGKIDRNALPPLASVARQSEEVASANDLEASIASIWCEMLGIQSVGMTDNFFDLGGHSLLVVQVQRCIKQELKREVPITDMFRFTTIRALAEHLQDGETQETKGAMRGVDRASIRRSRMTRGRSRA